MFRHFFKKKPLLVSRAGIIGKLTDEINNLYSTNKLYKIHRGSLPAHLAARIIQNLNDNHSASPLSTLDFRLLDQLDVRQQEGIIFLIAYLVYKIESHRHFLQHTYSLHALVGKADAEATLTQTIDAIKPYKEQEKAKKLLPSVIKFISSLKFDQGRREIKKNIAFGLAAAIAHFTDEFDPHDRLLQLFFQNIRPEFINLFHPRDATAIYKDLFFDPYMKNKSDMTIKSILMMMFGTIFRQSLNQLNKDIQSQKTSLLFTERANRHSYFSLLSIDIAQKVAHNLGWEEPKKNPEECLKQAVELPSTADISLTGINLAAVNVRQNP